MLLSPEKLLPDPCPRHPKIGQLILFSCDPGIFQAAASSLRLGASEFVWKPYKNSLDFPQPSSSPGHKPLWVSKLDVMRGSSSQCRTPGAGEPKEKLRPLSPQGWGRGSPWTWYASHLWITALRVGVLTRPHLGPSYPSQRGPFLMSWVVGMLFFSSSGCLQRRLLCV